MVSDATTPITAPEMEILGRAAQAAGSVIVAVTKTDKNLRRWRAIVDDDRRLIREHLGRDVPVIGVSSLRAVDAAEMEDPERRARVERTSGIAELRGRIAAEMARGALLSKVAALSMAETALEGVAATIAADLAAVDRAEESSPSWRRVATNCAGCATMARNGSRSWRATSPSHGNRSWRASTPKRTASASSGSGPSTSGMKVLRSKPQVFTSRIEDELSAAAETAVNRQLEVLRREANALFGDDHEWEAMAGAALMSIAPAVPATGGTPSRRRPRTSSTRAW